MSNLKYVIEKNGIFISETGTTSNIFECIMLNTEEYAKEKLEELKSHNPELVEGYTIQSYKVNYAKYEPRKLANLHEIAMNAREMSQEKFDAILNSNIESIFNTLEYEAGEGRLALAYELEVPLMEHERKVALCKNSSAIAELTEQCKNQNVKSELQIDRKSSIIRFIFAW